MPTVNRQAYDVAGIPSVLAWRPSRGLLLALVALAPATEILADAPRSIVLIGKERDHPKQTHEYMAECRLLAHCLEQTPGVRAHVVKDWPSDPGLLRKADGIVLYTAMGGNLLWNRKHRPEVEALLQRKGGLVALHWSTGADEGPAGERLLETLGGWFGFRFSKFLVRETTLRQVDPMHPISRGWKDFPLRDEYYTQLRFHPRAVPVLRATVDGVDYPVAWTFERPGDGGRSFGFVCGHFHDNFAIEAFRKAIVNAILWSVNLEPPETGAPVTLSPSQLELPPDPRPTP